MAKLVIIGPAHPLRGGLATFNQRLAKQFQQLPQQVGICLYGANNFCIRHRDHFASLQRHRAIGPEHAPAHGELSDNFSSFPDVINDLVPVLRNCANLDDATSEKEEGVISISWTIENVIFFERNWDAIRQQGVAEFAANNPCQGCGQTPSTRFCFTNGNHRFTYVQRHKEYAPSLRNVNRAVASPN